MVPKIIPGKIGPCQTTNSTAVQLISEVKMGHARQHVKGRASNASINRVFLCQVSGADAVGIQ